MPAWLFVTLYGVLPPLNSNCDEGSDQTAESAGFPYPITGTCDTTGFTLADAVAACGGPVSYYAYGCTYSPASLPYQPDDEHTWTAYYGCCAAP